MCGRYAATKDPAKLAAEFDAVDATDDQSRGADYNVAPSRQVATVVQRHPRLADGSQDPTRTERSIRLMRWGLVPHWAKDVSIGNRMINTRSETAPEKPAFRTALARRRCLMPADGWYEWKRDGKLKQPFFMTTQDGASLAMAGIWSTWRPKDADPDEPPLVTCSVLTTAAAGQLVDIHDRMPLILPRSALAQWLDPDRADVAELLTPAGELSDQITELVAALELRPVSSVVNSVKNNGPDLLERVDPDAPAPVAVPDSASADQDADQPRLL